MITDAILKLLSAIYQFLIKLVPNFSFIENLVNAKNQFIDFISDFIAYTLYLFNVPILKLSFTLLIGYLTFLATEYLIKLFIKYVTRII